MNDIEKVLLEKGFNKIGDNHWRSKSWEIRKREDNWLLDFRQRTMTSSKNIVQIFEYMDKK